MHAFASACAWVSAAKKRLIKKGTRAEPWGEHAADANTMREIVGSGGPRVVSYARVHFCVTRDPPSRRFVSSTIDFYARPDFKPFACAFVLTRLFVYDFFCRDNYFWPLTNLAFWCSFLFVEETKKQLKQLKRQTYTKFKIKWRQKTNTKNINKQEKLGTNTKK